MIRTMLYSGNLLPDLQIMLYCQIFVKVKKLLKNLSKVDKNCASDWKQLYFVSGFKFFSGPKYRRLIFQQPGF